MFRSNLPPLDAYLADAMSLGAEAFYDKHPWPMLVIAEPSEEILFKIRRPETLIAQAQDFGEPTCDIDPSLARMVGASLDAMVLALRPREKDEDALVHRISVGRATESDVVLIDESVSRSHAIIEWDPKKRSSELTDLNARNGTAVDGRRLPEGGRVVLVPGAVVRFGALSTRYYTPNAFLAWLNTGAPRSGASPTGWPQR